MVFTAARLYTPLEQIGSPLLFVQDGTITKVSSRAQSETLSTSTCTAALESTSCKLHPPIWPVWANG